MDIARFCRQRMPHPGMPQICGTFSSVSAAPGYSAGCVFLNMDLLTSCFTLQEALMM